MASLKHYGFSRLIENLSDKSSFIKKDYLFLCELLIIFVNLALTTTLNFVIGCLKRNTNASVYKLFNPRDIQPNNISWKTFFNILHNSKTLISFLNRVNLKRSCVETKVLLQTLKKWRVLKKYWIYFFVH